MWFGFALEVVISSNYRTPTHATVELTLAVLSNHRLAIHGVLEGTASRKTLNGWDRKE